MALDLVRALSADSHLNVEFELGRRAGAFGPIRSL